MQAQRFFNSLLASVVGLVKDIFYIQGGAK
jgi:hypothetical protein